MRASHFIFIGVCIAWVLVPPFYPIDYGDTSIGERIGSFAFYLWIPAIVYVIYLQIDKRNKSKTTTKTI